MKMFVTKKKFPIFVDNLYDVIFMCMKKISFICLWLLSVAASAQTKTVKVTVSNEWSVDKVDEPVVVRLKDLKTFVENHFKPEENTDDNSLYNQVLRKLKEMDDKLANYYTNLSSISFNFLRT